MEEKEKKKTDSRKFVVWVTWLIISIFILAWCAIVMFVTKEMADGLVNLIEKVLSWFFAVSMMYLGMNVSQKLGFAFAEKIINKKEEEKNESNTDRG